MKIFLSLVFVAILVKISVDDIKKREISVWSPVILATVGILYRIFQKGILWALGVSTVTFVVLMLLSFLSKQALGYGDVAVICGCSVILGGLGTCLMLSVTLVLSTISAVVKVLKRRKQTKTPLEIPLVPYITAGFVLSFARMVM